jgi:CheY-like chemotaxis protein
MSVTVVLAVGLDSWKLTAQNSALRSAGYIVVSANSIPDAIDHFRAGDFDMVLLDHSISVESKEKLTLMIRASGSRTPVISIASSSVSSDSFCDKTLRNDSTAMLADVGELLAKRAEMSVVKMSVGSDAQGKTAA